MMWWIILGSVGWFLGTMLASRWTIGLYRKSVFDSYHRLDGADWCFVVLIFLATAAGWPLLLPVVVVRAMRTTPIGKWVEAFYTLDKDRRREVLAR